MCILITGTAAAVRTTLLDTDKLVESIHKYNGDGVGIMHADHDGNLVITKALVKTAQDMRKLVETIPRDDRAVAFHGRMRTHGNVDLENCHPYRVTENTWMMHNGVLSIDTKSDKSKSDTWHFIQEYLRDLPDSVFHTAGFANMLADYIGDNRFALMSTNGELTVINKEQGIEHNGVWFSNTYAWDPSLLIPGYRPSFTGYRNYTSYSGYTQDWRSAWEQWEDDDERYERKAGRTIVLYDKPRDDSLPTLEEVVDLAIENYETDSLATLLRNQPVRTVEHIINNYVIYAVDENRQPVSGLDRKLLKAWCGYDADSIYEVLPQHSTEVAESLLCDCSLEWAGPTVLAQDELNERYAA